MGFNILICDDSALARKMARSNLPTGFAETIYEVSNGMDALEVLAHHTIDLVLLDLTMPILGGISVLSEIKHRQLETFVIVVSGDIQPMRPISIQATAGHIDIHSFRQIRITSPHNLCG